MKLSVHFPNNIRMVMEAYTHTHTHFKGEDNFQFCNLFAALHWRHIENEMEEAMRGVFFLLILQESERKEIIKQRYKNFLI